MKIQTSHRRSNGFALVVTLSLLILLTIIAVGMLSLSSVSLRTSGQGDAMATARVNARLALMLAIGELQKFAGPDRAVTATSEILATSSVPVAKPNTAGVWESWWDFNPNAAPNYAAEKTNRFRRWLVSSSDPAGPVSRDFVKAPWAGKTIELVGNGSLGASASAAAKVTAGLVPVSDKNGVIKGAYAWHVSDESVKARINLYRDPTKNTTLAQKRALLAGHRPDPSVMKSPDGTSPTFLPTDLVAAEFVKAKEKSGKLLDFDQVELLENAKGKMKQFRHDVTPYSLGVLADVRRGGLKQDLSSVFEMSNGTAIDLPADFKDNKTPQLYQSTHGVTGVSDPYWSTLWGYYNSFRNVKDKETTPTLVTPIPVTLPIDPITKNQSLITDLTPKTHFPGPVIAKVEMVFSLVTREAASSYLGQFGPAAEMNKFDDTVNFIFTPQVTLHNPYNVNISFQRMVVTIINVPVAFRFTVISQEKGKQSQSVFPGNFESLNEWTQDTNVVGDKKFVLQIANWYDQIPGSMINPDPIVMKPGEVIVCTPYLNPAGSFLKDSRSGSSNDVFDWQNKLTSTGSSAGSGSGVKMKPGFTPGLGFENNGSTPSCRSSSDVLGGFTNWWMLMIRDPNRPRTPIHAQMDDTKPSPGHPVDKYFVEYQVQRPKWWTARPGTVAATEAAPFFEVSAMLQSKAGDAIVDYAKLKFDYSDDAKLKTFFNNRIYRCPADPNDFLTGDQTFVSATTSISAQAKVLPFAVFSAYARTTNGGVYETGNRSKLPGAETSQTNLLKDGRLAGKPFLFHNPSRAVVNMDLATSKPGAQPYELNLQPFLSRGDYENYMSIDGNRVPALTGNTTGRGIKSGSYLEIPTGPMQTIADFRRSNALTSSYLPHFVQPVGNSLLHPLMSADKVVETNAAISPAALLDHSVLANHAFYDRFYFSTFATRGGETPAMVFENFMSPFAVTPVATTPVATQSFQPYLRTGDTLALAMTDLFDKGKPTFTNKPNATAYQKAAEYQMVQGPFNVNSTSVQAWKAVLASMNKSDVATLWAKNATLETKASPGIPILAMSLLNGGLAGGAADATKIDDAKTNDWNGYRELSDAQLTTLATEIVKQVRLRGPFLSMSEFVNRQVGSESALTLSGALENALADSKVNEGFMNMNKPDPKVTELKAATFNDPATYNYKTLAATIGNPAAGAPGWISQGDLLRILEPSATVRSDTFVIRVCGEAQDASGNITARAYAEAVVQRVPEYVDSVNRPSVNAYDITVPTAVPSTASPANKTFGRRMNVVSFRWLSSNEI